MALSCLTEQFISDRRLEYSLVKKKKKKKEEREKLFSLSPSTGDNASLLLSSPTRKKLFYRCLGHTVSHASSLLGHPRPRRSDNRHTEARVMHRCPQPHSVNRTAALIVTFSFRFFFHRRVLALVIFDDAQP